MGEELRVVGRVGRSAEPARPLRVRSSQPTLLRVYWTQGRPIPQVHYSHPGHLLPTGDRYFKLRENDPVQDRTGLPSQL